MEGMLEWVREMEESPLKLRRGGESGVTVELLQKLLADTQAAILQNQREVLRDELHALEQNNNQPFDKVNQTLRVHDEKFQMMEKALQAMQNRLDGDISSTATSTNAQGDRDRRTIIIGGPKDTRRKTILDKTQDIIKNLDLGPDLDREPFVTGPRRSFCLIPFQLRKR